jgi:hypothetical protein
VGLCSRYFEIISSEVVRLGSDSEKNELQSARGVSEERTGIQAQESNIDERSRERKLQCFLGAVEESLYKQYCNGSAANKLKAMHPRFEFCR